MSVAKIPSKQASNADDDDMTGSAFHHLDTLAKEPPKITCRPHGLLLRGQKCIQPSAVHYGDRCSAQEQQPLINSIKRLSVWVGGQRGPW